MKGVYVIFAFAGAILVSCSKDQVTQCSRQQAFDGQEFYFFETNSGQYLAVQEADTFFLATCQEEVDIPDSLAVSGIFSVDGTLFESCDADPCFDITEFHAPECPVEYESETGDFSFYSRWNIASVMTDSITLHPSCLFAGEQWLVTPNSDSTEAAVIVRLALENINMEIDLIGEDKFVITSASIPAQYVSAYIRLFEGSLLNVLQRHDTLTAEIEDNRLRLINGEGDFAEFFAEPN